MIISKYQIVTPFCPQLLYGVNWDVHSISPKNCTWSESIKCCHGYRSNIIMIVVTTHIWKWSYKGITILKVFINWWKSTHSNSMPRAEPEPLTLWSRGPSSNHYTTLPPKKRVLINLGRFGGVTNHTCTYVYRRQ